ncbi:MAG: UvrD-helicase domain-containing protein [Gammaproteobacteria bacterium]|nr:UvrD-helicase domain-containing protein [Gammaproteobacteria bacterium]
MAIKLNDKQFQAVKHIQTPLLVLAGAGSGKTRVITEKIAYLIHVCGYIAFHITAVTFTNKAAKEMNRRVRELLPSQSCRGITISTFHTLGLKIIRSEHQHLVINQDFSIYDADDSLSLIKNIIDEHFNVQDKSEKDELAQQVKHQISQCKNDHILPQNINQSELDLTPDFIELYELYQEYLGVFNAVDFDDLILLPVTLFQQYPSILHKWQQRIHYLLVDEYQDTNVVQYELIKLLCSRHENSQNVTKFTVVGDDDQSIYCWRGARPENLSILHKDFPNMEIIKLEQNYRSTQLILDAANHVIQNNPHTFVKKLWSDIKANEKINLISAQDEEAELNHVISSIIKYRLDNNLHYSDFAILYRGNHQSRPFELKLRQHQIPFQVTGGTSFFAYTEIKDMIAYLKLLINPQDNTAFLRVINTPKRKIGHATIKKLSNYAESVNKSLFECCHTLGLSAYLDHKTQNKLLQFHQWIVQIEKLTFQKPINECLQQLINDCDYHAWLMSTASSESKAQRQIGNVNELVNWLARIEENHKALNNKEANLSDVVNKLMLMDILEKSEEAEMTDCVSLMTLHSAKGLEFPYVFIIGLEEDILPHQSSIENNDIEEERRLFYVGITRAKLKLTLSMCSTRKKYGEIINCEMSRFIDELPQNDIHWISGKEKLSLSERQKKAKDSFSTMRALLSGND